MCPGTITLGTVDARAVLQANVARSSDLTERIHRRTSRTSRVEIIFFFNLPPHTPPSPCPLEPAHTCSAAEGRPVAVAGAGTAGSGCRAHAHEVSGRPAAARARNASTHTHAGRQSMGSGHHHDAADKLVHRVRMQGRRARSATTPRGRVRRQRARQRAARLRTMPRRAPRQELEAAGMAEGAGAEAAADTQEGTLAEAAGDRVRRDTNPSS